MKVLLTGATGFIGSELLRKLLFSDAVGRVHAVIRPRDGLTGRERFERQLAYWAKFVPVPDERALDRLNIIEYDIERDTGLVKLDDVDTVFHSAATTQLDVEIGAGRRTNVFATQRILDWARGIPNLKRFVHYSTAYVSGQRKGLIREDDPPAPFRNPYERTKRESEDCVRISGLPYTIIRPSIVVGDSHTGYISRIKVLYSVVRMWLSGIVPRAPVDRSARVDLVPVDFVVDSSLALASMPEAEGLALHLCSGMESTSPREVLDCATRVLELDPPPVSPQWIATAMAHKPVRPFVGHPLGDVLDAMRYHLPYLGMHGCAFDTSMARTLLADSRISCPRFRDYGDALFRFLKDTSWGKRALPLDRRQGCLKSN